MRIAAVVMVVACGSTPPDPEPEPLPAGPSCDRAYAALERSLADLHAQAGKAMPTLPDRAAWIATCEGLGLSTEQLGCLEPDVAAAEPDRCVQALDGVDRTPIDQPFLGTLLAEESP